MTLLLDTHTLLWLVLQPDRLSSTATAAITDPNARVLASHVSLWEMSIKRARGRLDVLDRNAFDWFEHYVLESGLLQLPIAGAHVGAVEHLPDLHRDPFDRLLVAQARHERISLVSADDRVRQYDIDCVW